LTFNVQRFSTGDGPGIRTTVFMKGCPLKCAWCHNPEGLRESPELMWHDVRCIGHRACLSACPSRSLELTPSGIVIDRKTCDACEKCVDACPASALEVVGKRWNVDALLAEVEKDRVFYETSDGGVTISGGEPMMQHAFVGELLRCCKEKGIATALDTCGAAAWERFEEILPFVDLVLFDLKIVDDARHREITGTSNALSLGNARRIAAAGKPIWVRTPIVPGFTDDEANIAAIGAFVRDELPTAKRWDLLAYTNLGKPKYKRLDLPYAPGDAPLLTKAEMENTCRIAAGFFAEARWSGATR
jgi:pyruvate formate lyase activating enzyme